MTPKELRYYVMLALYFPILLYAVSTFDLEENVYAVKEYKAVAVNEDVVVLGQPFMARTFLAAKALRSADDTLSVKPKLVVKGPFTTLDDSMIVLPTAGLLDRNEEEKVVSYEAYFVVKQLGGAEKRYPIRGKFRVRRPEIVASSEATQTLYRLCRNNVRIEVPGLEQKPLKLKIGRQVVNGRSLNLTPVGEKAVLQVFLADSTGDVYLGKKEFAVIEPPRPEIQVFNAGRELRNGDPLPKRRAMLDFQVKPDEEFMRRFPQDAKYRIQQAVIYLRRGLAASKELGTFDLNNGNQLVLTRALRDAQPGDRLIIRLEGIERINHQGRAVPIELSQSARTFGFVIG